MIKLKNLWKIALAAMTMSAMLVACEEPSKGGSDTNEDTNKVVLAEGGEGVYSYTVNIADISAAWGGSITSPAFSVVLLTDEGLAKCIAEANFKVNPAAAPEYQIGAFGNMKIADTSVTGVFAPYGQTENAEGFYQYYNGVAVTIDDTTFTVTVDMTKIAVTDLKALWEGEAEAVMTAEDIVELNGYKPYVIALGTEAVDPDNKAFAAWSADVMKMAEGATFPANVKKEGAPVVLTFDDITTIAGSLEGWANTTAFNGSYTFKYETSMHQVNDGVDTNTIQFKFTNGTWDLGFCGGAKITALGAEVEMAKNGDNIELPVSLLEEGKEYTITITKVNAAKGKVKVTAK